MTTITNATSPSASSTVVPFEVLLVKMQPHFEYFAKRVLCLKADNFDDAVQELTAIAYGLYHSAVQRGKEPFYTPLMKFAIKRYREGRLFMGSSMTDLFANRTRMLERSDVCSLTMFDVRESSLHFLIDKYQNVARTVQFRIDFFEGWLRQQTERDRAIIVDLAMDYTTNEVAKKYGVSAGLISQYRRRYAKSWGEYISPPEKTDLIDELKELADKEPA